MIARIAKLAALALAIAPASLAAQDIAVRAETLHTMEGPAISDGVVVIRDGKIAAVGPAASTAIPEGMEVLTATVATPGLVDARTVVGLAGFMNQPHDQDQLDGSAPVQPQLRAIDGYNPEEELVDWLRSFGVTTIHTGHGPGAVVSGQTMVAKTWAKTADAAAIVPRAMIAANLGPDALDREKGPGTRSKQIALLRAALTAAGAPASAKGDEAKPDKLDMQVWRDVLARRVPLMVTANRAQDIMSALRLKDEFGIDMVIDGGAESYLLIDELREAGVTVILHPTMARHYGDMENASFATAATLREAGIPFALQSGYEGYVPKTRVILWEAGWAAANGLAPEHALSAITSDAAQAIGMADRVGSLKVGKDGDVALFDGDPLEYASHVTAVVIDGRVASRVTR
ncbi:amidohydrolase family protein [Erythrobacter sp.]|uniref:amidohydrolase family protein n=1 Tax=Erythrobacter sp. TaxID=1042 RepID=UPI001B02893C|nr:amidohydrolase family protein [Erythrobacter sp.]MBO6527751.1 amidohydrolase family protein [Erythrobacter sp.]MBO6529966.1 amidohydrolase family protein [Erythrobacter sp.]